MQWLTEYTLNRNNLNYISPIKSLVLTYDGDLVLYN